MIDISEHPDIRSAERTGYPRGRKDPAFICDICDAEIYEGDVYYDLDDLIVCAECIENAKKIAKNDEWD